MRRPIGVFMFTMFVIIIGLLSLSKLKLDLYPNIQLPYILVFTTYEGAGSEEIESMVTRPLEGAISAAPNVKKVTSTSSPGSSVIFAECKYGANMDFTNLRIRERIDMVKRFLPADATDPMLFKVDVSMMPICYYGVSSPKGISDATRLANDKVKVALERIPGVATVSIMGGLTREIKVLLSAEKMAFYKISPGHLTQVIRGENVTFPGGVVKQGTNELIVRTLGEFQSVEDLKALKIPLPAGGSVPLQEIARIEDSYHDQTQYSRINSKESILVILMKESDANTVLVTREVRNTIKELEKELDGGISFQKIMEQAEYIEKSINNVVNNAVGGAILAVMVLFVFLWNFRSTFIISVAIPISIIMTFTVIYFSNMTLNLISMGGLALGVGMLVDNAIVALEVIHRYREEGHDAVKAATEGTSEIAMAITASTLTTVVVFIPVLFVEGITAQIFREMALVVTISLLASLVVSLTVVPTLSAKIMDFAGTGGGKAGRPEIFQRFCRRMVEWFENRFSGRPGVREKQPSSKKGEGYKLGAIEARYRQMLEWAVGHRGLVALIAFGAFFLGLFAIPFMKTNFTPTMGEKQFTVSIEMPLGTNLETTNTVARIVEAEVDKIKDLDFSFTMVGSASSMNFGSGGKSELATIMGIMKPACKRSVDEIVEELRTNEKIRDMAGAKIKVNRVEHGTGELTGGGAPVTINVEGPDIGVLQKLADQVKEAVKSIPGARDVETSWQAGRPEMQIRINRQRAAYYGLNPAAIATTIQTCFQGTVATRIRLSGEEYDVLVQLAPEEREKLTDLTNLFVTSPAGIPVPLSELADFQSAKGPNQITRENQTRQVKVLSQFAGKLDLGRISHLVDRKLKKEIIVPTGYNVVQSGAMKEMADAFIALTFAFLLAAFLVYMVIAVQYENLVHPIAIMGTLPITVFGVTWSLVLTGRTFDVAAFIGVIMLAGIVVNNAIVLVDYIETLRSRGMDRREAILKAGPTRLRPVLMTTLTTVLGLIPLALGIGEGAEMNVSLATVVIGGLIFCTFLTLIIIPVIYSILDDIAVWTKKKFMHKKGSALEYHR